MGSMRGADRNTNNRADVERPTPKSKNKKSLGASLRSSPGTRKTKKGEQESAAKKTRSGKRTRPGSPNVKAGTVHRSRPTTSKAKKPAVPSQKAARRRSSATR